MGGIRMCCRSSLWCGCVIDVSSGASCRVVRLVCVVYSRNPICNQSECFVLYTEVNVKKSDRFISESMEG